MTTPKDFKPHLLEAIAEHLKELGEDWDDEDFHYALDDAETFCQGLKFTGEFAENHLDLLAKMWAWGWAWGYSGGDDDGDDEAAEAPGPKGDAAQC